eukprot:Rmarinus@m.26882
MSNRADSSPIQEPASADLYDVATSTPHFHQIRDFVLCAAAVGAGIGVGVGQFVANGVDPTPTGRRVWRIKTAGRLSIVGAVLGAMAGIVLPLGERYQTVAPTPNEPSSPRTRDAHPPSPKSIG